MKPAPFEYERPTSVDAVLSLLATRNGGAKIIAGGQSLVPMMNFRVARPDVLVDINRIPGLGLLQNRSGGARYRGIVSARDARKLAALGRGMPAHA